MNTLQSIGIDVGKRELVACIRCSNGTTAPPAAFPNSSIGLKKFLVYLKKNNVGPDAPILLESTGPYHWQAARTLADAGCAVRVANPLHTKQIARLSIRKRKTDKVDAANLAFLASQGYGYPFIETKDMARKKALVRHYWKLRATATNHLVHERYLKEYRGIARHSISSHHQKMRDIESRNHQRVGQRQQCEIPRQHSRHHALSCRYHTRRASAA